MGIRGLNKYVESNFDWEDLSLGGGPIVLDGNSLPHYLSAKLEWKYGGQYAAFKYDLKHFFDTLLGENIQPIHVIYSSIDLKDKLKKLNERREKRFKDVKEAVDRPQDNEDILPPLFTETFRTFLIDYAYNKGDEAVKIYCANDNPDGLAVSIANTKGCPLLGEDSDFFIPYLRRGYLPLKKLEWQKRGLPVKGKVYSRGIFAASLGISPDLIIAIPAICGNISIPNLIAETSLKFKLRGSDSPNYRSKDCERAMELLKVYKTEEELKKSFQGLQDGRDVLSQFTESLSKARTMHDDMSHFREEEFKMSFPFMMKDGHEFPSWMIKQYRGLQLSNNLLQVLIDGTYFLRIVPDDYRKESTMVFSRPIRQEVYGIMAIVENVHEVVREGKCLVDQFVSPKRSLDVSLSEVNEVSQEVRIEKLCSVLLCDANTLSSLDQQWYIAVGSVCFWAKTAHIPKDDLKIKALLLCFASCYEKDEAKFDPVFNLDSLHVFTQWQCVYHDAILLNQILALPLPYLSPASLFDGRRVTYYCDHFDTCLYQSTNQIKQLYDNLFKVVCSID